MTNVENALLRASPYPDAHAATPGWMPCLIAHQPSPLLPQNQSSEKLVPHPHADFAFGLRTAKWLPISSSV